MIDVEKKLGNITDRLNAVKIYGKDSHYAEAFYACAFEDMNFLIQELTHSRFINKSKGDELKHCHSRIKVLLHQKQELKKQVDRQASQEKDLNEDAAREIMGWVMSDRVSGYWVKKNKAKNIMVNTEVKIKEFKPQEDWTYAMMLLDNLSANEKTVFNSMLSPAYLTDLSPEIVTEYALKVKRGLNP